MLDLKKELMNQYDCDNCGKMDEYVGCTIEKLESGGIKFLQKVLVQSFNDEFDIEGLKKFNTPATPGTVLKKPVEGDVLLTSKNQMVRDLARHMGAATKVHWDAMFRMMKYVCDTKERDLTLSPT